MDVQKFLIWLGAGIFSWAVVILLVWGVVELIQWIV